MNDKSAFLIGKSIYLRPLVEVDCEGDYVNWFNDPEVCKGNAHHLFPYDKVKATDYIKNMRNSSDLILAIVEKSTDKHIGNIALQNIDYISQNAEFAIILGDKNSWGKGYSKEAAELIVNHGFSSLNLQRVYCATFFENIAMKKLANFLGMKEEGLRRKAFFKNGKFVDILEYGLLKDEFYNLRSESLD